MTVSPFGYVVYYQKQKTKTGYEINRRFNVSCPYQVPCWVCAISDHGRVLFCISINQLLNKLNVTNTVLRVIQNVIIDIYSTIFIKHQFVPSRLVILLKQTINLVNKIIIAKNKSCIDLLIQIIDCIRPVRDIMEVKNCFNVVSMLRMQERRQQHVDKY